MKIIYKKGDLLKCEESVLIHGCNAQGRMGSGIALGIKREFPEAFQAYQRAHLTDGLKLGTVVWATSRGKLIGNAITQQFYGREPGKRYVSYDAVRQIMRYISLIRTTGGMDPKWGDKVAMPKIGAGLAQGDWKTIAEIIEEDSTDFQPIVYEWDQDEHGGK
jgi:O-acetyl-ADP-ribose deacetylase (regulator of RNase III)